jgi:hypothetical protein
VTICGHSLGGGLSQYLGYDAAREYPAFRKHLVVHTHNGFGGMAGIARMHGSYDRSVVEGVTFRNYRHPDDPVSRIGGHAGGVYNLAVGEVAPAGLLFAHSNDRFLGGGQPPSPLESAIQAKDEVFDIVQTIEELGPELSAALRQVIHNDDPIRAFAKISRIITSIPPKQRAPLFALVNALLPFRALWQRLWRRPAR